MIRKIITCAALALGFVGSNADAMKMGEHFTLDVVAVLGNGSQFKTYSKELEFPKGNQMGPDAICSMLSQLGEEAYEAILKTGVPSKIFSDYDYRVNKEYHSKANRLHYNSVLQPWINYFCKAFLFTDTATTEINGASLCRCYDTEWEAKKVIMKEFCSLRTTSDLDQNGPDRIMLVARVRVLKN